MILRYATTRTPLGRFTVAASERGVVATFLDDVPLDEGLGELEERLGAPARRSRADLAPALREVGAYLAGDLRRLRTPVDLSWAGDGFFRRVYEATMRVPYGELRTYGDVAAAAGSPRAWRAAGHALRVCPIELWIPCHRVVPAGPGLGTYGGHPDRREFLLRLEGAI